jgi:hypothetical protein
MCLLIQKETFFGFKSKKQKAISEHHNTNKILIEKIKNNLISPFFYAKEEDMFNY